MHEVISADDYFQGRSRAEWAKRDAAADAVYAKMSIVKRAQALLAPVRVGEVDFGPWNPQHNPVEAASGLPRRMPLYLFCHDSHRSLAYPNGYPGHNERLVCHCGYRHLMFSTLVGGARAFGSVLALALRKR